MSYIKIKALRSGMEVRRASLSITLTCLKQVVYVIESHKTNLNVYIKQINLVVLSQIVNV